MENRKKLSAKREIRCDELHPNGKACGLTFARNWNLKRHKQQIHWRLPSQKKQRVWEFVHMIPVVKDPEGPGIPTLTFSKQQVHAIETHDNSKAIAEIDPTSAAPVPKIENSMSELAREMAIASAARLMQHGMMEGGARFPQETTLPHLPWTTGAVDDCADLGGGKRRRLKNTYIRERVPLYDIKRSRKAPNQVRALEWLSEPALDAFQERLRSLLNSWGVQDGHVGTCVLSPTSWNAVEPAALIERFSPAACPRHADRQVSISQNKPRSQH